MLVFYDVVAYCETFRAWIKISFIILSCRGPGGGRPWPNPTNANSRPYSSASPGNYVGPPGGGGPPGTPIMPSPAGTVIEWATWVFLRVK